MLDRSVLITIKNKEDYAYPFRNIEDRLNKADLLFGNLESVISDKGFDQGGKYSFRAPPQTIKGLTLAGFDILSMANNHPLDWGRNALADSKKRLEEENISPLGAGLSPYKPTFIDKEGVTFGFLAYTDLGPSGWKPTSTSPGVAIYEKEKMINGLKEAQEKADIVIVSLHFGPEYQTTPSSRQKDISQLAIEKGADLVVGHHPHVIQPVKEYKDGLIAYSLGNFIFDQDFSEETMEGLVLDVWIKQKEVSRYETETVPLNETFQPTPK